MDFKKLFNLLVLGGTLLGTGPGCDPTPTPGGPNTLPGGNAIQNGDGGVDKEDAGKEGGGVHPW